MAVPVWVWPAAKKFGVWLVTNGPSIVELGKKYGPPIHRGYQEHGFKPIKIGSFVQAHLAAADVDGSKVEQAVKPGRTPRAGHRTRK